MLVRTLVLVPAPALRRRVLRILALPNVLPATPRRGASFWEAVSRESSDLIVVGRSALPEPIPQQIAAIRGLPDSPEVIVISDREDPGERAALLGAGCLAVIYEGLPDAVLQETFSALIGRRREEGLSRLRSGQLQDRSRLDDFVSSSPAMQDFMKIVRRVVASDSSLLILGETGVGKERLARAIHEESSRAGGPFIPVNCGAMPETLLESELFGHEEGAFTGAIRSHRGYFELAHGGTIFLDEIAEMPAHLQVKLLRVLQERRIHRIGSERPVTVDVRVMAATNRDLAAELHAKRFRPDLYYRLGVVTLTIPPLRERSEDIPALVDSYLGYFCTRLRRPVRSMSAAAREALARYSWPGNVRELINVIERAVLLCAGDEITLADLPETFAPSKAERGPPPAESSESEVTGALLARPLREARRRVVEDFERKYLIELLRESEGRIGRAARRAGMGPRSLFDLLRKHGLRKEEFRGLEGAPGAADAAAMRS